MYSNLRFFLFIGNGSITSKKKFIGWKSGERNHRFLTILPDVDLALLETMFNEHSYHPRSIDFKVI